MVHRTDAVSKGDIAMGDLQVLSLISRNNLSNMCWYITSYVHVVLLFQDVIDVFSAPGSCKRKQHALGNARIPQNPTDWPWKLSAIQRRSWVSWNELYVFGSQFAHFPPFTSKYISKGGFCKIATPFVNTKETTFAQLHSVHNFPGICFPYFPRDFCLRYARYANIISGCTLSAKNAK